MECNKDEAVRAKAIAEEKLLERDITGAKKFALKAQNLFPELDGLSQFLEIINVHVAHEKKINGEADYYVDPLADEEVLRKQYKRLALSLHPDKNKSVGADGAFKVMHEAWSVLSDKNKRSAYDLKLNISASNQTASFPSSSARYTTTSAKPTHVPARPRTPGTAHKSRPVTFWTLCNRCRMQFEYQKIYLNQILMCTHCQQPFLAKEKPNSRRSCLWPFRHQQDMPAASSDLC